MLRCPVEATWKDPDGIIVVDYDWCIGCRYCMAACPYDARRFNFSKPKLTADQMNPNQGYLSNRVRPRGVVEKCTFCLHRTREGKYPACLEVCPTGARVFGTAGRHPCRAGDRDGAAHADRSGERQEHVPL